MNNKRKIQRNSKYFLFKQLLKLRLFADLKRSFLGWAWLVILPFFAILTWIFMKGAGIINPGDVEIPYTSYILLSTTIWAGFFESYKNCSQIFQTYGKTLLVNKLPIDIIVLNEIIIGVIKFVIPFLLVVIYFLVMGISLHPLGFLFPFIFLPLILLGAFIGIITSLFNAIAKDFTFLVDNIMRLMMLLSPVVYSPTISKGLLAQVIKYNPLTYLLSSSREILLYGHLYQAKITLFISVVIFVLFALLSRFFKLNVSRILERGDF